MIMMMMSLLGVVLCDDDDVTFGMTSCNDDDVTSGSDIV